jgi:serine/threonine protein kinase
MKKMLEQDPDKRLSAAEALTHPFFKESPNDFKELPGESDPTMEEYGGCSSELSKLKDK